MDREIHRAEVQSNAVWWVLLLPPSIGYPILLSKEIHKQRYNI